MAIDKIQSESINLADNFAFTGTVSGAADNKPSFLAYRSSSDSFAYNVHTRIDFNTEKYDSNNCFDNSSAYKFTPGVAGKFFLYAHAGCYAASHGYKQILSIYKNGTAIVSSSEETDLTGNFTASFVRTQSVSVTDISDADDYYQVYIYQRNTGNDTVTLDYNANYPYTHFGGYKILT
tara:strand:- start:59 stop:592 length:534 start_codon:yes stop_codon:yes gene_type:complete